MKKMLGWGLLGFALFSLLYAGWLTFSNSNEKTGTGTQTVPDGTVVVYFIHGRAKCPTCDLILAHTRKTLETTFAEETRTGRLVLVQVDVEKPGNEHFMEDFNLFTTSIVLYAKKRDGEPFWRNLDKAWELAEDEDAYKAYFSDSLRLFLEEAGA